MEFSDQALILRTGKFKEADLWVRMLSPDRGLYTAFAFGGSRSIKRFCGCLDFLNTVLVRVDAPRTKGYMALKEGTLMDAPRRLRSDFNRLGMAVNCIKFMEAFEVSSDSAAGTHRLLGEVLRVLEDDDCVSAMLPMLFRFRFAALQGFSPQINSCRVCNAPLSHLNDLFFQTVEGGVVCPDCMRRSRSGPCVRLAKDSLAALVSVQQDGPGSWKYIDFDREMREQCSDAVEGFIHYHVGLAWQGGYFRRI